MYIFLMVLIHVMYRTSLWITLSMHVNKMMEMTDAAVQDMTAKSFVNI